MTMLARIALALLLLAAAWRPAAAVERILEFISDVQVERNGDLQVTETIRVQAEGREIRRGILRDFPTSYHRADGTRVEIGFEVESVTRDGSSEEFATERLANGTRIRIGSAGVTLPTGPHLYVIHYRTTRQIGFYPSFDELYWNATGTGWTLAIDRAEAHIRLPVSVPFRKTAIYTGPQGARGSDATVVEQGAGRIVFRTTRPLPPRHGLTVAAAWDKGVVAEPGAAQRAQWWLLDNLPLVAGGGGLALLILYCALAWLIAGRDPRGGTIIPRFAAPEGLSAAATRYIWRMEFDNRAFAAAVLDLAVHGHLSLSEQSGDTVLNARKDGKPVGPVEQQLIPKLFGAQRQLVLKDDNHEIVGGARSALEEALAAAYEPRMFFANRRWSRGAHAIRFAMLAAVLGALAWTRGIDDLMLPGMAIVFGSVGLQGATVTSRSMWRSGFSIEHAILLVVQFAFAAVGVGLLLFWQPDGVALAAVGTGLASAPIMALAPGLLKAPTREGRRMMDEIEGLRQYLGVAEEDRLAFLHPPEKTPELFERFLPYAIALDVENVWAQRFAGVLAAAATAAAAGGAMSWYHGDRDALSDPARFADRLGSDLSSTIASASTPPGSSDGGSSSSGSSGGGSSGGGGGGGGGSGW